MYRLFRTSHMIVLNSSYLDTNLLLAKGVFNK